MDMFRNPPNEPITTSSIREQLLTKFPNINKKLNLSSVTKLFNKMSIQIRRIHYISERKNHPKVKLQRKEQLCRLMNLLQKQTRIFYMDETSLNLELRPLYTYAHKGKSYTLKTRPKSKNYTLISAIDKEGHIASQVLKGGMKGQDFAGFPCCTCKLLEDSLQNGVIFLDNAASHKSKFVKQSIGTKFNFCLMLLILQN